MPWPFKPLRRGGGRLKPLFSFAADINFRSANWLQPTKDDASRSFLSFAESKSSSTGAVRRQGGLCADRRNAAASAAA